MKSRILLSLVTAGIALTLSNCGTSFVNGDKIVVSVRDQKMVVLRHGEPVKAYKISTSKFGLGDQPGSHRTPLGRMKIAKKIGDGQPAGAVFKSRRPTGEVIEPNAPGRDPIVSRILWLTGTESNNRNAFHRYIYIHGTPEVCNLGKPASYGCIRMGTKDVVDLYDRIHTGAEVHVIRGSLRGTSIQKSFTAAR